MRDGIFNEWGTMIAKSVMAESEAIGKLTKHTTSLGNVRETVVRDVLERFLPTDLEVGTGQIVDMDGNLSKQIDIIIAKRDIPILRSSGGFTQYMAEAVVATIEVKTELTGGEKGTLWAALDNCLSVARLNSIVDMDVSNNEVINNTFKVEINEGTIEGTRLAKNLINAAVRPQTYILSLKKGFKKSETLIENVRLWINSKGGIQYQDLPSLIIEPNCFGVRNDEKLFCKSGERFLDFLGGDREEHNLSMFIWHLLRTTFNRSTRTPDRFGFVRAQHKSRVYF